MNLSQFKPGARMLIQRDAWSRNTIGAVVVEVSDRTIKLEHPSGVEVWHTALEVATWTIFERLPDSAESEDAPRPGEHWLYRYGIRERTGVVRGIAHGVVRIERAGAMDYVRVKDCIQRVHLYRDDCDCETCRLTREINPPMTPQQQRADRAIVRRTARQQWRNP